MSLQEEALTVGLYAIPSFLLISLFFLCRPPRSSTFIRAWAAASLSLQLISGAIAAVLMYSSMRYYQRGGGGEFWLLNLPMSLSWILFFGSLPASVAISLLCAREARVISAITSRWIIPMFIGFCLGSLHFAKLSFAPIILISVFGVALSAFFFYRVRKVLQPPSLPTPLQEC